MPRFSATRHAPAQAFVAGSSVGILSRLGRGIATGRSRSGSGARRYRVAPALLVAGALMASLAGPVQTATAATLTFGPIADAYVSSSTGTSNFGTAAVLQVGASPSLHTYLQFDVEGVSGAITSATLRLYATTAGSGSSVHGTSTAWTETGITYANAPTYGATIASVSNFAAGAWITYNVSSLVVGNGLVGFAYTSASASPISFASREDAAHAPQLLVTPTAGATVPILRRAPYLTDLSASTAMVNVATDTATPAPVVAWGPADGDCTAPLNSVTAISVASFPGFLSGTIDYQFKAPISGLQANGTYCYRVLQNGADLVGAATTFTTAPEPGTTAPFSFAVIGDWGGGTVDEANILTQVAAGQPRFVMTTGDNVYTTGDQTDYGDLNGGKVFKPAYLPRLGGGTPIFPAQGNHGYASYQAYLDNFPQDAASAASGGTYSPQPYCCAAGTVQTSTYASAWYAFTWGNARFYVLEAAWADGDGTYQADFTDHWNGAVTGCVPCGQEQAWLTNDLAANASVPLKFAFFHYPLHADGGHPSDTYLDGTAGLEGLLARNGVDIAFSGHAHIYERNLPQIAGSPMVTYVTGGGGASVASLTACSTYDAYALGTNTSCNAPLPTSNSQVFHYLKVTVDGSQVTVTPTSEAGQTFDVQSYAFGSSATVPGAPTGVSASAGNAQAGVTWSAPSSDGGSAIGGYTATATPGGQTCTTTGTLSCTLSGLTNGTSYTFTVTATNGIGTGPPSAPSNAVTPTAGATVFADDFELGNLSRWTSVTGLSIQSQIKYAGAWAARATSTGTPRFAYKQLAATSTELYYRQRFYVVSQSSSTLTLGTFQTSAGAPILDFYRASTGKLCLRNDITAAALCSATKASLGAWHQLQVRVKVGAPGSTEVWLDGVRLTSISLSQSLGTISIGRVQLGDSTSGRTYDAGFDDVTVGTSFITP